MNRTIEIAPVRKSLVIQASQAHAFEVFTARVGDWWPKTHGIVGAPLVSNRIELRVGGRWVQRGENGVEAVVGKVLVYEPPERFVFTWEINASWKPQANFGSEVEVRFTAQGPKETRVDLEHRKFEQMGAEQGATMRSNVENGWPTILGIFKEFAEQS